MFKWKNLDLLNQLTMAEKNMYLSFLVIRVKKVDNYLLPIYKIALNTVDVKSSKNSYISFWWSDFKKASWVSNRVRMDLRYSISVTSSITIFVRIYVSKGEGGKHVLMKKRSVNRPSGAICFETWSGESNLCLAGQLRPKGC